MIMTIYTVKLEIRYKFESDDVVSVQKDVIERFEPISSVITHCMIFEDHGRTTLPDGEDKKIDFMWD